MDYFSHRASGAPRWLSLTRMPSGAGALTSQSGFNPWRRVAFGVRTILFWQTREFKRQQPPRQEYSSSYCSAVPEEASDQGEEGRKAGV